MIIFRCEQDKGDRALPKFTFSNSLVLMRNAVVSSSTKPTILENTDELCVLLLSYRSFPAPGTTLHVQAVLNKHCRPYHTTYFVPEPQADKLLVFDFTETATKSSEFFLKNETERLA